MLLTELKREKQPTYVGMKFADESLDEIMKLSEGLPARTTRSTLHVTVIYSKAPIVFTAKGELSEPFEAKPKKYSLFTTDKAANCLVMELDCDELVARHKKIMKDTGASYDFPVYHPHVTLSYDVGDGFDIKTLPDLEGVPTLYLTTEYSQKLDFNWGKKNVK